MKDNYIINPSKYIEMKIDYEILNNLFCELDILL
jgi:hypothetical protein